MTYPIDVEKYIWAMRIEFGTNRAAEEGHRALIPLVNACYADGLRGADGYPLDLDGELRALSSASGKDLETLRKNPLLKPLIQWCNAAYAQGRKEAAELEDAPNLERPNET